MPAPAPASRRSPESASEKETQAYRIAGEAFRRRREELGLSKAALARASGHSTEVIRRLERGQANPQLTLLYDLAHALDAPLRAFFEDCP